MSSLSHPGGIKDVELGTGDQQREGSKWQSRIMGKIAWRWDTLDKLMTSSRAILQD